MSQLVPSFVTFNVAGQRFTTTRDTLLKEPSSRLAMLVRGVLPCIKDDAGAVFLDRDSKYFQLMLNYLRDGWCSLPTSANERRELLQEVRWYQLASMEAWLKAQEVAISLNEAASRPRPSSAPLDPYAPRPSLFSSSLSTPASPVLGQAYSVTTAVAGDTGFLGQQNTGNLGQGPFRSSFLAGANQDLLAAGALASCGILNSSSALAGRFSTASTLAGPMGGMASSQLGPKISMMGAGAQSLPAALPEGGYLGAYPGGASSPVHSPQGGSSLARIPLPLPNDGYKWTNRLLQTNPKMQEVINTLLELAYLPPHAGLHAGKISISCTSECSHDLGLSGRTSSLLLSAQQQLEAARFRNQVIRVSSNLGWSFELAIRAASDVALHDKYNMAGFLQDNWFMVTAVLKEQYGITMEEDLSARPSCLACRRHNITLHLQKIY